MYSFVLVLYWVFIFFVVCFYGFEVMFMFGSSMVYDWEWVFSFLFFGISKFFGEIGFMFMYGFYSKEYLLLFLL